MRKQDIYKAIEPCSSLVSDGQASTYNATFVPPSLLQNLPAVWPHFDRRIFKDSYPKVPVFSDGGKCLQYTADCILCHFLLPSTLLIHDQGLGSGCSTSYLIRDQRLEHSPRCRGERQTRTRGRCPHLCSQPIKIKDLLTGPPPPDALCASSSSRRSLFNHYQINAMLPSVPLFCYRGIANIVDHAGGPEKGCCC